MRQPDTPMVGTLILPLRAAGVRAGYARRVAVTGYDLPERGSLDFSAVVLPSTRSFVPAREAIRSRGPAGQWFGENAQVICGTFLAVSTR